MGQRRVANVPAIRASPKFAFQRVFLLASKMRGSKSMPGICIKIDESEISCAQLSAIRPFDQFDRKLQISITIIWIVCRVTSCASEDKGLQPISHEWRS